MIEGTKIAEWNARFAEAAPEEVLRYFLQAFRGRIALSSSLSMEDQVLTDLIVKVCRGEGAAAIPLPRIFTLDTGRLFPQTYKLIAQTEEYYGLHVEVFFPDYREVQRMVREEGINLFYRSPESRHRCCAVRKLEPLRRAFRGLDAWVCGLRREQSVTRRTMQPVEWDALNGLLKINPLISWTEQEVRAYVRENGVPYNRLHDKGYPSIGCEPCTRAVAPGDDPRSGRWWWEAPDKRECGLHQR